MQLNSVNDFSEAITWSCSTKKLPKNISQNSQENICVGASFLVKIEGGAQLY